MKISLIKKDNSLVWCLLSLTPERPNKWIKYTCEIRHLTIMESFESAKPSKCWSFRFYGNDFYNRWRKSSTFYVFVTIGIVFSDLRIVCIILNIYWNKFPLLVSSSKFFHYLYLLLRISLSDYRSLNHSWLHYYTIVIKICSSFCNLKKITI